MPLLLGTRVAVRLRMLYATIRTVPWLLFACACAARGPDDGSAQPRHDAEGAGGAMAADADQLRGDCAASGAVRIDGRLIILPMECGSPAPNRGDPPDRERSRDGSPQEGQAAAANAQEQTMIR